MLMSKFRPFALLLLLCSAFSWSVAQAQEKYTYDPDFPLIQDVGQLSANSIHNNGDGSDNDAIGLSALIDGVQNWFHSEWGAAGSIGEPHYLQVELTSPVQKFFYTFTTRGTGGHDTWKDVDVYVTNTPGDDASWEKVVELRDILNGKDPVGESFTPTVPVDLGAAYTGIRFSIVGTTTDRKTDDGYWFWNLDEFQMYEAVKVQDQATLLRLLCDSVQALNIVAEVGTLPGQYTAEAALAYENAFGSALAALDNMLSEDEYAKRGDNLRAAIEGLKAGQNLMSDGYYYVISAFPGYEDQQGVKKAWYVDAYSSLRWETLNEQAPAQLFKITKLDTDTTFSIQSVATGEYVNTVAGQSVIVPLTAEQTTAQIIRPIPLKSLMQIANVANTINYHTAGHSNGAGVSGTVVPWGDNSVEASTWTFLPCTDEALIAAAAEQGPKLKAAKVVSDVLADAKAARNIANTYDALLTDVKNDGVESQIMTNAPTSKEGSLSALIDGNINTYFHSTWEDNTNGFANLQIDLRDAQEGIIITFTPRQSDLLDFPTNIDIYATNDESIGTDPQTSSVDWTPVTTLSSGFPTTKTGTYTSPVIKFDQPYRFVRFDMTKTQSGRTNGTTGQVFFTLSEFMASAITPNQYSEYYIVPGMKEACDALDALITKAEGDVENLTAQLSDTTALKAAAKAVRALYVDRDAQFAEFATVLDSAKTAYETTMGAKEPLIGNYTDGDEGCQLSSNAKEPNEGSYAALGDGDPGTLFHSAYSEGAGPAEGVYHNLQIDLKRNDIQNFFFEFVSRGSGNHDTPNLFDILATNDADLYADAESDDAEWTLIKTVDEPDMPNTNAYKYTSEYITMDSPYRYLRFVVKHTTDQEAGRVNQYTQMPYFNLSEFQIYTGVDPDRLQYNYNPEVKATADALKALIDAAEGLNKFTVSPTTITDMRAGVNALLAAYVDTTQLVKLYNTKKNYASLCIVDPEAIACINNEEAIETYLNAIKTARYSIDVKQPTKASVNQATADINAAYDVLMQSMNKVEPNKWYYIISKSTNEYCANQAIYLNYTSTENDISFGQYNEGENNYEDDPYAMWRIVPIEGTDYYGIQNMGTAHYFGPTLGRGNEYRTKTKNEPYPFRIDYIGKGQLQLVSIDEANAAEDQIHAQQDGSVIVAWPTGLDGASCWTFKEVDVDNIAPGILIAENSIRIQTLPFDIPAGDASLMNFNDDVKTYAIKSLTTDPENNTTTLELTIQEDVKAGVPFILEYGNYEEYSAENSVLNEFYFLVPDDVSTTATEDNGLIGTLDGLTIEKSGFGYLTNGGLAVTGAAVTSIIGQRGYIDPAKVQTREGNTDRVLVLEGGLINGAKPIVAGKATENINVYTIDGKLLKRNVKATDASKGLKKGIYIMGKQKIAVK